MNKDASLNTTSLYYWNTSLFFQLFAVAASTLIPLYWQSLDFSEAQIGEIEGISFLFSLIGPLIAAYYLRLSSYRILVSYSFLISSFGALVLIFTDFLSLKIIGLILALSGISITATLVPLSSVALLSAENFGSEYARYRKIGSYGFLAGLLMSGFLSDIFGAVVYPLLIFIGFFAAGITFLKVPIPEIDDVFNETFNLKKLFFSKGLVMFGLAQLVIWSSFSICFRYLPLRMSQMNSSSLFISLTIASLGIIAIFSLPTIGQLIDRISSQYLWPIIPVFLFLRIYVLSMPETNYYWFLPMQLLHIPTWVLGDLLVVKYLRDKREKLGALGISVLTQFGMILGLSLGSILMSRVIPITGLKESFVWVSILPVLFLPLFFMNWVKKGS